jgi:hypothetical protein
VAHRRDLELVPIDQDEAKAFVRRVHRHNKGLTGMKFQVGLACDGEIVAVGVGGRPVASELQDGWTVEINRVASDGHANANSMLYGALCRAAFALGYRKVVTYTLKRESGTSLRAAGFVVVAQVTGREWNSKARPRVLKGGPQLEMKLRWERVA